MKFLPELSSDILLKRFERLIYSNPKIRAISNSIHGNSSHYDGHLYNIIDNWPSHTRQQLLNLLNVHTLDKNSCYYNNSVCKIRIGVINTNSKFFDDYHWYTSIEDFKQMILNRFYVPQVLWIGRYINNIDYGFKLVLWLIKSHNSGLIQINKSFDLHSDNYNIMAVWRKYEESLKNESNT